MRIETTTRGRAVLSKKSKQELTKIVPFCRKGRKTWTCTINSKAEIHSVRMKMLELPPLKVYTIS